MLRDGGHEVQITETMRARGRRFRIAATAACISATVYLVIT